MTLKIPVLDIDKNVMAKERKLINIIKNILRIENSLIEILPVYHYGMTIDEESLTLHTNVFNADPFTLFAFYKYFSNLNLSFLLELVNFQTTQHISLKDAKITFSVKTFTQRIKSEYYFMVIYSKEQEKPLKDYLKAYNINPSDENSFTYYYFENKKLNLNLSEEVKKEFQTYIEELERNKKLYEKFAKQILDETLELEAVKNLKSPMKEQLNNIYEIRNRAFAIMNELPPDKPIIETYLIYKDTIEKIKNLTKESISAPI